jgi:hypothetical protein
MTSDPAHDSHPSPRSTSDGGPQPEAREAWSALSHAHPEEILSDDPQPPPEHVGPRLWPRIVGVLILLVGAGGAWIWQNPGFIEHSFGSLFSSPANQDARAAAIRSLEDRVAELERRQDPAALATRIDALEKQGAPAGRAGSTAPADLRPLLARLDTLEARARTAPSGGGDVSLLQARIDALEKALAQRGVDPSRIDALTGQIEALSTRDPTSEFRGRLDEITAQIRTMAAGEAKLAAASDHAVQIARLAAAQIALQYGRPLGPVPEAPPALTRFASAAPPTEASLRLDFVAAAQEALKVSQPDTEGKPFLDRVLARLQDFRLITVREGDHVVIGTQDAATLTHAQGLLDAGDLDGAIAAVTSLSGPPKQKMAGWLADATALRDARAALAAMAGNG